MADPTTKLTDEQLTMLRLIADTHTRVEFASWKVLSMIDELRALRAERDRLFLQLNTPHTADFIEAVRVEAAHQRERWGSEHDTGKTEQDWFWLLGYLAGKAIRPDIDHEKKLHHIITTAAACLNWHAYATGADKAMRPGIEPPKE
jgi:hypothetical protein